MQNIEKALYNVFSKIGNSYNLPQGEFLQDVFNSGQTLRNPYFGQIPANIKFMFGTQKELNIWLKDTKDKYPLVWLVYPYVKSYNNNAQNFDTYNNAKLIFAINNDADKLVQTRVHTTKFILDSIIDEFTRLMRNSSFKKYIYIDKVSDSKETWFPNYSTSNQKEGGTIEIWDAIVLETNIYVIPNCIE